MPWLDLRDPGKEANVPVDVEARVGHVSAIFNRAGVASRSQLIAALLLG